MDSMYKTFYKKLRIKSILVIFPNRRFHVGIVFFIEKIYSIPIVTWQ